MATTHDEIYHILTRLSTVQRMDVVYLYKRVGFVYLVGQLLRIGFDA